MTVFLVSGFRDAGEFEGCCRPWWSAPTRAAEVEHSFRADATSPPPASAIDTRRPACGWDRQRRDQGRFGPVASDRRGPLTHVCSRPRCRGRRRGSRYDDRPAGASSTPSPRPQPPHPPRAPRHLAACAVPPWSIPSPPCRQTPACRPVRPRLNDSRFPFRPFLRGRGNGNEASPRNSPRQRSRVHQECSQAHHA